MSLAYDWLYPILTPLERSKAVNALRWQIRANLYNSFWVSPINRAISCFPEGNGDNNSTFQGSLWMPFIMSSKMGGSHPWLCMHAARSIRRWPASMTIRMRANFLISI